MSGESSRVSGFSDDFEFSLRKDHQLRPIWVSRNCQVVLEMFSAFSKEAQDFLVTISEPVSRPLFVQEYKITGYSLCTAISLGFTPSTIISLLDKFSKVNLPKEVSNFITRNSLNYGKVTIVLEKGKYFLEAVSQDIFSLLCSDKILSQYLKNTKNNSAEIFEIETVKRRCNELSYLVFEEHEFKKDAEYGELPIELKKRVKLRPYQHLSLSKIFGNNKARSGIIVLPCGAGKTLVGIAAAVTIKQKCLVLCMSGISVHQWAHEFFAWTNIKAAHLEKFSSETREISTNCKVFITTYSMVSYTKRRSYEADKMMKFIKSNDWGLVILDEVHIMPANVFKSILSIIKVKVKLGLTATFVREDNKIESLNYMIGPKLYEADWINLANKGYIARAKCSEVLCPMPAEFYKEYLKADHKRRQLLYAMNPYKMQACQHFVDYHASKGDKTVVFSDSIFALKHYANKLSLPFLYGGTSSAERMKVLENFRSDPNSNTLFMSRIGDTSIDLPEVSCLIQISSHYGSRRQEAQRLGRVLRAKVSKSDYNSYFYSLISKNTEEVYYSLKRRRFLVDQGYSIDVISSIERLKCDNLVYSTLREQLDLLNTILLTSLKDEFESEASDCTTSSEVSELGEGSEIVNVSNSLQSISGGASMAYMKVRTSARRRKEDR